MPSNTQQKDHQTGCGFANSNGVEDVEQGPQNVDIRLLKTLSSHLDLLYAGSLFLLPSILPYVASVLVSYSSSNASSSHETTAKAIGWGLAWATFLTCVGVILPLAAFKIMTSLENDRLSSKNANMARRSGIMACPTVSAIKRTWMALKGDSPGYGPLALDASNSSRLYDESEDDDENVSYKNIHRPSVLPRPKTIIMTSLGIWTLLMTLSACLGLNTVTRPESTLVTPETTRVWEAQSWSNVHVGGFVEHEVQPKNSVSALTPVLDADMEQAREKSPFATIQADVVILDKRAQEVDVSEQDVEDFMDPDALEAMTLDPEDASVLKSFLNHLQADDEALKAMENGDRMVEGNLPCGYEKPLLPNMARKLFGKASDIAQTYTAPREQGQVFDYIAGWTELMIFFIAMCLGTLVVGLAQARALHFQLLEQHMMRPRRRISLAVLAGCLVIAGSALGLTMAMILAESWDLPSVQFVGIGIAGMILVHAWIPNLPLYVESGEFVYMSESESEEDDDENEEKTPVRRNACSLDERRRCELTSYRV